MVVTRREFLASAAGALAMALPVSRRLRGAPLAAMADVDAGTRCALVDLADDCAIRESLAGYELALSASGLAWLHADARSLPPADVDVLLVPAALALPSWSRRAIDRALARGATVLLESGAVFADPDSRELDAHRRSLGDHLGIRADAPVHLWPRPAGASLPYVEYRWPTPALVRDHTRALPLAPPHGDGEIIARVDGLPVALRRRVGPGTLLFLGSPLGPALRAGDAEATRWLREVLAYGSV